VLRRWLKRRNKLILVSFLLVLVGCSSSFVEIRGERIYVEIADTPDERERGLMFREDLCSNCGMLFVFEEEGKYLFWMKNVSFPLDFIFINKEGIIVDFISAEPCVEDPCTTFAPSQASLYVLEVNRGEGSSFSVGDRISFSL